LCLLALVGLRESQEEKPEGFVQWKRKENHLGQFGGLKLGLVGQIIGIENSGRSGVSTAGPRGDIRKEGKRKFGRKGKTLKI